MSFSIEQQRAIALANARKRQAEASIPLNTSKPMLGSEEKGIIEKGLRGAIDMAASRPVGLTARHLIRGVASLPLALADAPAQLGNYVGGYQGTLPSQRFDNALNQVLPQPQTAPERIAGSASEAIASVAPMVSGAGLLGNALKVAESSNPFLQKLGLQAISSLSAGASGQTAKEMGAGTGGQIAASLLGGAIVPTVAAAGAGILNTVKPNEATALLAQRAKDLGIDVNLTQLSDNPNAKRLLQLVDRTPFSGIGKFNEAQNTAFHRQLASTLGQEADNLSPEVIGRFKAANSRLFNAALEGKSVSFDPSVLKSLQDEIKMTMPDDAGKVVSRNIQSLIKELDSGGQITGEKLSSFRSMVLDRATSAKGDIANGLSNVVSTIDDAVSESLPEVVQDLSLARNQWRNWKTIQPLLEKSTDGMITPSSLLSRVASNKYISAASTPTGQDKLVDLGRIGNRFLKQQVASSGTAENLGVSGLLGAGAAAPFYPPAALTLGALVGGNTVLSAASRLGRNQTLVNAVNNKALNQLLAQQPSLLNNAYGAGAATGILGARN